MRKLTCRRPPSFSILPMRSNMTCLSFPYCKQWAKLLNIRKQWTFLRKCLIKKLQRRLKIFFFFHHGLYQSWPLVYSKRGGAVLWNLQNLPIPIILFTLRTFPWGWDLTINVCFLDEETMMVRKIRQLAQSLWPTNGRAVTTIWPSDTKAQAASVSESNWIRGALSVQTVDTFMCLRCSLDIEGWVSEQAKCA